MMTLQKRSLLCLLHRKVLTRRQAGSLSRLERHARQIARGERSDELPVPLQVKSSFKLLLILTILRALIDEPFITLVALISSPFAVYMLCSTAFRWVHGAFI